MGVSTKNIAQTLQYGLSDSAWATSTMNGSNTRYWANQPPATQQACDLKGIYIRSDNEPWVQLDNLIELTGRYRPSEVVPLQPFRFRHHLPGLADGKTIGQGLDEMDKIAKETLDETFRTHWTGDSKEYRESSSSLMFAFIPGHCADLPDSCRPVRKFQGPAGYHADGASRHCRCTGIHVFRGNYNEYIQPDGIIMLIGLVAKNGILIVEFANQKQEAGEDKMRAIKDASLQRLRPILMTMPPPSWTDTACLRHRRRLQPTHRHG
nr:efflux RND transporter permease subunit [Bacteroides sp. CACC 737]